MGTPCRECPSIICRQCIELTGQDWDQVRSLPDWSCPRCEGDCPCKRCRNKVANGKSQSPPKNKRKRPATIREDNAYSPKFKKLQVVYFLQSLKSPQKLKDHESKS